MSPEAIRESVLVWRPTPGPQERFVAASCFEVLFGGAAGGGKSDGLLLCALRHVENPHYAGLLLRRTYPELIKSGGLVERSHDFYPALGGRYTKSEKTWRFPSGARIEFGCMERADDVQQYKSSAFQFVGFDELTTFLRSQYVYMPSRMRSAHGIPLALRATTNPDGPGRDWVLERFAPFLYPRAADGEEPPFFDEYDGPRVAPETRLYYALRGSDPRSQREEIVPRGTPGALGRTFIPSLVSDNPYLRGTEYERALDMLDPVQRQQLKHGDWMARAEPGAFFQRAWVAERMLSAIPRDVELRVRYWDRAATSAKKASDANTKPWTAGVRMSRIRRGLWCIEDVARIQAEPAEVEAFIRATAIADDELVRGSNTRLVLELDPAQAGKFEAAYYMRELAGHDVHMVPPQGDKLARFRVVTPQFKAGNILMVRGRWNEAFFREGEACPNGLWDQLDGVSGAFRQCITIGAGRATTRGHREMANGGGAGFAPLRSGLR